MTPPCSHNDEYYTVAFADGKRLAYIGPRIYQIGDRVLVPRRPWDLDEQVATIVAYGSSFNGPHKRILGHAFDTNPPLRKFLVTLANGQTEEFFAETLRAATDAAASRYSDLMLTRVEGTLPTWDVRYGTKSRIVEGEDIQQAMNAALPHVSALASITSIKRITS